MLLRRNSLIFERFFFKNMPHLVHLCSLVILVGKSGKKQNIDNTGIKTTLTQPYHCIMTL